MRAHAQFHTFSRPPGHTAPPRRTPTMPPPLSASRPPFEADRTPPASVPLGAVGTVTATPDADSREPDVILRRPSGMLTRRQTLRALGAAGAVAPALSACAGHEPDSTRDVRLVKADVSRSTGDPSA